MILKVCIKSVVFRNHPAGPGSGFHDGYLVVWITVDRITGPVKNRLSPTGCVRVMKPRSHCEFDKDS